jgi:hypothetical protein
VLTDFAGALPLESLLRTVGEHIGVRAVFHDEVREVERRVRLDYGQRRRTINGYIEVKAPGHVLDPAKFSGHARQQWERQRDLPNLVYTNGTHWRMYRDGALLAGPVVLDGGDLAKAGKSCWPQPGWPGAARDEAVLRYGMRPGRQDGSAESRGPDEIGCDRGIASAVLSELADKSSGDGRAAAWCTRANGGAPR